ncbi:hypothetical protein LAUMK41_05772 [Mycobacterium attenuatum]|nr:hypothetical protein LAUMK41_05772 [Mycobacterium attenuatum]
MCGAAPSQVSDESAARWREGLARLARNRGPLTENPDLSFQSQTGVSGGGVSAHKRKAEIDVLPGAGGFDVVKVCTGEGSALVGGADEEHSAEVLFDSPSPVQSVAGEFGGEFI